MNNPWGLSKRQAQTVEATYLIGQDKEIAKAFGITPATVINHLRRARKKMGTECRTKMAVMWDRHIRMVIKD